MRGKPPSSIEYGTLLHELALESFRRALVGGDLARARASAERLTSSSERFWRFVGLVYRAEVALARARVGSALETLSEAEEERPELEALGGLVSDLRAHVLIESGRPELVAALDPDREGRPLALYWSALAGVRAGRQRGVEPLLHALEAQGFGGLAGHVRAETHPREDRAPLLERAVKGLGGRAPTAGAPVPVVRYALADALEAAGDTGAALESFEAIRSSPEALLDWQIPAVRARYRSGAILRAEGRREEARELFEEFLGFWEEGELEPEWVESARQFVRS